MLKLFSKGSGEFDCEREEELMQLPLADNCRAYMRANSTSFMLELVVVALVTTILFGIGLFFYCRSGAAYSFIERAAQFYNLLFVVQFVLIGDFIVLGGRKRFKERELYYEVLIQTIQTEFLCSKTKNVTALSLLAFSLPQNRSSNPFRRYYDVCYDVITLYSSYVLHLIDEDAFNKGVGRYLKSINVDDSEEAKQKILERRSAVHHAIDKTVTVDEQGRIVCKTKVNEDYVDVAVVDTNAEDNDTSND